MAELRSGKYQKGTIKSDHLGRPVFENESDKNGYCACAIMVHLYGGDKFSLPRAVRSLGLTAKDCAFIQRQINDTPDDFITIADRIEGEVFKKQK